MGQRELGTGGSSKAENALKRKKKEEEEAINTVQKIPSAKDEKSSTKSQCV